MAFVTPVHRKNDPQLVTNYRPISLTTIISKTLEKIVRKQMICHLLENSINPENQDGFMRKRSRASNLLNCLDKWTKNFDHGLETDVIYLDFQKCFDSVSHSKLLFKLSKIGFEKKAHKWLNSFLTDRKQCVKIGNCLSEPSLVLSGVPQGTVLGPILFLCFTYDLPSTVLHSEISMYADDSKLFRPIKSVEDVNLLQEDLNRIVNWAKTWRYL